MVNKKTNRDNLAFIFFPDFLGYLRYINYTDYFSRWTIEKLVIGQCVFFDTFIFSVFSHLFFPPYIPRLIRQGFSRGIRKIVQAPSRSSFGCPTFDRAGSPI
jgi:hypothetical protein